MSSESEGSNDDAGTAEATTADEVTATPGGNGGSGAEPPAAASEAAGEQPSEPTPEAPAEPTIEGLTAERNRIRDRLLRTAADFDNFRKRTRRDLEEAERRAHEQVLVELLPLIDNLERADAAAAAATDAAGVAEGVRMVLKQFEELCARLGIERIKSVGERFDPSLHDALQQLTTTDQPPGTIVAEVSPGYTRAGRLLRAAAVVVARPPAPDEVS